MTPLPPAVSAEAVSYRYGDRLALDCVDFTVDPGVIYGFLGPNGSGKSTLFRLLATLIPPQGEGLSILGQVLGSATTDLPALRRRLGVVFQYPSLDLDLTVGENLTLQGRLFGISGADLSLRRSRRLEQFGLTDRVGERTRALSGGLRRRVELAKALVSDPRVLLLDEPSTGLDPAARRQFWNLLETLRRDDDVTVLLTTHFFEEAEGCDRVLLLDEGRVAAKGQPSELTAEVGTETLTLSTTDPDELSRVLAERYPDLPTPWTLGGQLRLSVDGAADLGRRLHDEWPERVRSFMVGRPTLEDVFMLRTGRQLREESAS
ncbi:MAG: ABC transporter ATP-binding protein [Thermoanaerobaculia bacterium]|nr:ABC transporter ATP-binding protein [Thermoanaerobaculia bacterium]